MTTPIIELAMPGPISFLRPLGSPLYTREAPEGETKEG